MNILLWVVQALLALTFFFSGGLKLVLSSDSLQAMQSMGPPTQIVFSGSFLKFIGVCEILGGIGLILPGVLRRQQYLTPLAAAGLIIVMIGAVTVTIIGLGFAMAITPLIVGLLCVFVAYGRWKLRPLNS